MILTNTYNLHRSVAYTFLFVFLGGTCLIEAGLPKMDLKGSPFNFDAGGAPKNGLMPMPTEQEMQEIEKFLSTLSDSEIEELIKYGENITKIAEENNIPLFFEPTGNPSSEASAKPATPPGIDSKKDTPESKSKDKNVPTGPELTKDDIIYYKKTLENLITIIQTIRQRLASIKKFEHSLNDLNKELDSLIYYLHVLQKESIVSHLKEKKYEDLVTLMNTSTAQLAELNEMLDLPSVEILHQYPLSATTKKQLKSAEKTIASIKKTLDTMLHQKNIISTIETLLKEYEPVALQIRQKNEEKEKSAYEFVKKVPITNVAKQVPGSPAFTPPYQGPRQNTPMNAPIKPMTSQQGQKGPDQAGSKPTKMVEPVKKQQSPAKPKKATLAELEKDIIDAFDSIEQRLVPHRAHINDFLTTYATTKTEPEMVTSALNDANYGLKKAKTLVDDWYKKLEKDSTSKTDMEKKAKGLRDVFKNNMKHNNLKTIHAKSKTITKGTEGTVKRFKEIMDGIEKRIIDIF